MLFLTGACLYAVVPSRCSTFRWCLKNATSFAVVSIRSTTPRFVRLAVLHRSPTGEHLGDDVLFADAPAPAHELDLDALLPSDVLGVLTELVAQRLRPARIVKEADISRLQVGRHSVGVAEPGERSVQLDTPEVWLL